jgi:hypothetical protein
MIDYAYFLELLAEGESPAAALHRYYREKNL